MITSSKRRSVKLTKEEFTEFKKWVKAFDVKVQASEELGITRQAVDRIMLTGSASPETIQKIREVLNAQTA